MCERWRGDDGFANFYADMGDRPKDKDSIERIDNDGAYERGNCKWATRWEQARNKRSNRRVDYQGEQVLLIELAERCGVDYDVLYRRVAMRGWDVERALGQPVRQVSCLDTPTIRQIKIWLVDNRDKSDGIAADLFGVGTSTIDAIRRGLIHADVAVTGFEPYRKRAKGTGSKTKLTWIKVREIRSRHGKGEAPKSLADAYNVSRATIYDIVNYKTWQE